MTVMEWTVVVWAASFLLAGALFLFVTLVLIPILNPRFDPDWKEQYHRLTRKGLPFFGVLRTIHYAGAVVSQTLAWRVFRTREYDFRGRVGGFVYSLCVIQQIAIFYGFLSLIVGMVLYLILEVAGIPIL